MRINRETVCLSIFSDFLLSPLKWMLHRIQSKRYFEVLVQEFCECGQIENAAKDVEGIWRWTSIHKSNLHPIEYGCTHNNNENNTKRNWIILLNIIYLRLENTQHYLDWGVTLALFKEIQALGWLNLITGADIL